MNKLVSTSIGVVLAGSVFSANATNTVVDFTGTISLIGIFENTASSIPAEYNAISGAAVGETIVGWFSFENNPALYPTVINNGSILSQYKVDSNTPVLTGFEFSLPAYDFTISRSSLNTLIPGSTSPLKQYVNIYNNHTSLGDAVAFSNSWLQAPNNLNLNGAFGIALTDSSKSALASTSLPTTVNLADYDDRTLQFSDSRYTGFTATRSIGVQADLNDPDALPALAIESNAFGAFGGFEATNSAGEIVGWQASTTGSVDVLDIGGGNSVASLTTGSPVSISQSIITPDSAFEIVFDYQFLTTSGALDVLIDDIPLVTIDAPESLTGSLETHTVLVTQSQFRNLADAELKFLLTAETTAQIYLDDITAQSVQAVPVPAAIWFMGSALLGLTGMGYRSRQV